MVEKSSSVRIIRPAFFATSVPLPMAMPMCAALIDGSVVDAVAGHRDDVVLLLQGLDQEHLVLGRDAADDADVVDAREPLGRSSAAKSAPRIASPSMPTCSAMAAPVTTSSPVTMRTRMCAS